MAFLIDGSAEKQPSAALAITSFEDPAAHALGLMPAREVLGVDFDQVEAGFYRERGKRVFDLTLGSLMLLAAAPILLGLMLLVSLDGGKPVFAHLRVGKGGRMFRCFKIRSMRLDAEAQLAAILASDPVAAQEWAADHKLSNDPRVTRLGAFLRRSSLDELPQLWNVLRGDMSLVGPRPVTEAEIDRYGVAAADYMTLRPGLTGPWQVDGRNDISYDARVAMDVAYARDHDLRRDFGIVLRTGFSVLKLTGR